MAIDYNIFYSSKGAAYRKEKVVSWSAYFLPVDHRAGRIAGNSRIWGDASHEVQRQVIDALIAAAKKDGFTIRRIAMLLAMAKIESGFNPDAAAGTTSASGLGQFVKKTGDAYGLTPENRFEIGPSIDALIAYFKDNEAIAAKKKKPDYFVYKYHHDGPSGDYGGEALATSKFAPLAAVYEKALTAGHVLNILDPGGQPIADAQIKVTQQGKSAMMKTNEHGASPTFMASPDFGPITVFIKKADDSFKQLGELAIDKLESMWTLVAPNERVALKTHLHDPVADSAPAAATGTHKVKPGETMSRIARDNGATYQEICKLNGIEKPYTIYPGQVLKLPPKKAAKSSTAAAGAGPAAPAPAAPAPAAAHAAPATVTAAASATVTTTAAATVTASAPPAAPPGKPTVNERRDEQSKHPVANVVASAPGDKIAAAIAYAMKHKEAKSLHMCLKYVKRALFATKNIRTYPGIVAAKSFGPFLGQEGFKNLLVTRPGVNLNTAPVGAVIIYEPVEMQEYEGKTIYGHIEIKTEEGYVSDFFTRRPTYLTDPVTMVSPVGHPIHVSYKVIGIWFKE